MCKTTAPVGRHHPNCLLSYLENAERPTSARPAFGSTPMTIFNPSAIFGHTLSEPCPFMPPQATTDTDTPAGSSDSFYTAEAAGPEESEEPEETETDYESLSTPRCDASRAPPGLNVHPGTWSWCDFQFSCPSAARRQQPEDAPVSPRTSAQPHSVYWLPPFLEEGTRDLFADPVEDEDGDEETPKQIKYVHFDHHAGGNYFLPASDATSRATTATVEVGKGVDLPREKGKGNVWPLEMLSPYPYQLDGVNEWYEKREAGADRGGSSKAAGQGWRAELPMRGGI